MPHISIALPPKELLLQFFSYDPATGNLISRKTGKPIRQINANGYIVVALARRLGRKITGAARIIYHMHHGDLRPTDLIDHIDGNPQNNRVENLRKTTQQVNTWNTAGHLDGQSGLKGVSPHRGRWRAQLRHNGKNLFLGSRATPEEAHVLYVEAVARLRGSEFLPAPARLRQMPGNPSVKPCK